ncbi:RraA family protein [Methylobacterium sp. NEAU 140]|uniref:RraA family protein n=1 Tax=Methylobacterium sp. NEAU 140 TaxID=3064945 RepID=UPI0027376160|nr:RraA family protein [Methylobacterium sp. NEAU 140]MDP4026890.1 RraA family protein [Methylobacterium sp. NEAU 140]
MRCSSDAIRIHPAPPPPEAALLNGLRGLATSHISDAAGFPCTVPVAIRPMHRSGALCGPAITVRTAAGDNLMVQKAVDLARPGDVVVVAAGGCLERALVGEIVSRHAAARGVAGFVVDGAIRDLDVVETSDLPIFARGVSARGPTRQGPGTINAPVTLGDVTVHPGDLIVGDRDGIVVVPCASAVAVAAAARALAQRERDLLAAIDAGLLDRAWVDEALRRNGCALE